MPNLFDDVLGPIEAQGIPESTESNLFDDVLGPVAPIVEPVALAVGRGIPEPKEDPWGTVLAKSVAQATQIIPKTIAEGGHIIRKAFDMPESEFRKSVKQTEKILETHVGKSKAKKWIGQSVRTGGEMVATGFSLPLLSFAAGTSKGGEAIEEGKGVGTALTAGAASIATEFLTEKIPFDILLKPGKSFIKRLGQGLITDIPGELVATFVEMKGIDEGLLDRKYTDDQLWESLVDTMAVAGITTGGMTTITHPFIAQERSKNAGDKNVDINPANIAKNYVDDIVSSGVTDKATGDVILKQFNERSTPESTPEENAQIMDELLNEFAPEEILPEVTPEVPIEEVLPEAEVIEDPVVAVEKSVKTDIINLVDSIEPTTEVEQQVKDLIQEELVEAVPVIEEAALPEAEVVEPVIPGETLEPSVPEAAPVIERPPTPEAPIKINIREGVAELDDQNQQILEAIKFEVEADEAGRRIPVKTNGVSHTVAESSTFPDFFQNKKLKKKPVLLALNKALAGKKLAPGQERTLRELHEGFQRFRPESVAQLEDFETIHASILKQGDSFDFEGNTITVRGVGDDGTLTLFDRDNTPVILLPDEDIDIDRGSLKRAEAAPEAPAVEKAAPAAPQRVRIGKSPQAFEVIREVEQTPEEKELGEKFFEIRNEKTQEVQTVSFEEMKPIRKRVVSDEALEKAKANIKEKFKGLKVGIDPTLLKDYAVIGAHHLESGFRTFNSWSKKMIEELGEAIKPHLRDLWAKVSKPKKVAAKRKVVKPEVKKVAPEKKPVAPSARVLEPPSKRIEELRKLFKSDIAGPNLNETLELAVEEKKLPKKKFGEHREYSGSQKEALSKIGVKPESESIGTKLHNLKENLGTTIRQKVVDQYASLKNISEQGHILAVMSNTSTGALEAAFKYGKLRLTKDGAITVDETGKGLANVLAPLGKELDDFLGWIAGNRSKRIKAKSEAKLEEAKKHQNRSKNIDKGISRIKKDTPLAQEDLTRIKKLSALSDAHKKKVTELKGEAQATERLFSDEDIEALVKLSEGTMKDGRPRKLVYNKALREINAFQKSMLDIAVKTGTINEEERASWDADFYVPFYRVLEEAGGVKGPRTLDALAGQTAIQRLKGSDVPLNDMLQNILMNWNHLLNTSLKNQAGVVNLEAAENVGAATQIKEKDKNKNSVFVRKDGKKVWYDVHEPLILEAISSLSHEGFNSPSMRVMRKFKRAFTMGVTASPEFRIANLMRDTIQSVAVGKTKLNMLDNVFGKGWSGTKKDSLTRAKMLAGGGEIHFGHLYGADPEGAKLLIEKGIKDDTILDNKEAFKKFNTGFRAAWDSWNEFGSRLENVNRAALYQERVKAVGELRANFEARDLMNFTNSGAASSVRFLTQVVPFLNARLQGLDKMGRAMADKDQRRQFEIVTGGVALASIALYLAFKDDDDFKEREQWDRDTYWWFKLPGSDVAFRIPKPFEVGAIGTLAERMVEQIVDDEVHGELFAERLGHMIAETFSFSVVPQALQPALDIYANKNPFTKRPIESLGMERLSPTQRRKAWTSETAIGLSEAMDKISWGKVVLSPVQIEHLIGGYLGWLGSAALGTIDQAFTRPIGNFPAEPTRRIDDYPAIGRFVRSNPSRNTKYATLFYAQMQEMKQAHNDVQNLRKLGDLKASKKLRDKKRGQLKLRGYFNSVQKKLNVINRKMKRISASKKKTSTEKRNELDLLTVRKNRLTRIAIEKSNVVR